MARKIKMNKKIVLYGALSFLTLAGLGNALATFGNQTILPYGTYVGSRSFAGMTRERASATLQEFADDLQQQGIVFSIDSTHARIFPQAITLNPDLSPNVLSHIIEFSHEKTVDELFQKTVSGPLPERIKKRIVLFFTPVTITPSYTINADALIASLKKNFAAYEIQAHNAVFSYDQEIKKLVITPASSGREIAYDRTLVQLKASMENLHIPSLQLSLRTIEPHVQSEELEPFLSDAQAIIPPEGITLKEKNTTWHITPELIASWITKNTTSDTDQSSLTLDQKKIEEYLARTIAPAIFVAASPARYEISDGRATSFQEPIEGVALDVSASAASLVAHIRENKTTPLALVTDRAAPQSTHTTNEYAIQEIIASATTDFKGSPPNRRKNIVHGMKKIDGLIIEPDQEFSLIRALGDINKENGFLPELVIKGNKTTPEFGGGLCQVSTTLFRAVTAAGLAITERRNHSFRVSYYEPPVGFDATIYSPAPDFKFKNDTGSALLIQAKVEGTKAIVTLWGTKDERTVEVDTPTVFNVRQPGPTKLIETEDLKPGEKKCTEKARPGADAIFERRIFYPDGEMKKDVFKSHYIIWPAVCFVGKTQEQEAVTSTPALPSPTF